MANSPDNLDPEQLEVVPCPKLNPYFLILIFSWKYFDNERTHSIFCNTKREQRIILRFNKSMLWICYFVTPSHLQNRKMYHYSNLRLFGVTKDGMCSMRNGKQYWVFNEKNAYINILNRDLYSWHCLQPTNEHTVYKKERPYI